MESKAEKNRKKEKETKEEEQTEDSEIITEEKLSQGKNIKIEKLINTVLKDKTKKAEII